MTQDVGITAIAHVIQLAVAPVFLLTGVAALLGVLTSRLARIIDRARVLEERLAWVNPSGPRARRFSALSPGGPATSTARSVCRSPAPCWSAR